MPISPKRSNDIPNYINAIIRDEDRVPSIPRRVKKKRHKPRPCGNPPAIPTGVTFVSQATEALNHLRFTGKVRWNEVTTDEQGHGTKIQRYDIQLRVTNASGTPIENQDSLPRLRMHLKAPERRHELDEATNPSGSTFRFKTRTAHGMVVGDKFRVRGCKKPDDYNSTVGSPFTVNNVVDTKTIECVGDASGVADCESPGNIIEAEENDDKLHIIVGNLPRPKSWYWQTRVRSVDESGCRGDWSSWTSPVLPWTGSDPQPPAPTFGADPITFQRVGRRKRRRTRMFFTFDEVGPWDVPGGDTEDDMAYYQIVVDRAEDASGITDDGPPWFRKRIVTAKLDDDADTERTVHFDVHNGDWYRCKVRSIDRFGRRGDWSAWTDWNLPFDDVQPPQPENVKIYDREALDRVVVDWVAPLYDYPTRGTVSGTSGTASITGTNTKFLVEVEAGERVNIDGNNYRVKRITSNTALSLTTNLSTSPSADILYVRDEHHDVARYRIQLANVENVDLTTTPDDWNDVYDTHFTNGNTSTSFKIPAADQDESFVARVQSIDANRNRSKFVPATTGGNSDPDVSASPVSLGVQETQITARRHMVTWTVPGTVVAKEYDALWTADMKYKLIRVTARCGRHRAADHPASDGTPGGTDMIINLRHYDADEANSTALMDKADRLRVNTNSHRDTVWRNEFNVKSIGEGEYFSLKVAQVGSTRAGKNLVVQLVVEEDAETSVLNTGGYTGRGRGRGTMNASVV